eukprot:c21292_g1_i1.p1 GENE.c21292_g1_i1~~c21292_g1_i1.p1  ORF type:complete len:340 (-),score=19.87 c21292_g1_i1:63-1040(-)
MVIIIVLLICIFSDASTMKFLPDMTKSTVEISSCLDAGNIQFNKMAVCVAQEENEGEFEYLKKKFTGVPVVKVDDDDVCKVCQGGVNGVGKGGVPVGFVLQESGGSDFHLTRLHRENILDDVYLSDNGEKHILKYTDFNGGWWSFADLTSHLKYDDYVRTDTMSNSAVCDTWGRLKYMSIVKISKGEKICVGKTQSITCKGENNVAGLPATEQMQVYMGHRIKNDGTTDAWAQYQMKAQDLGMWASARNIAIMAVFNGCKCFARFMANHASNYLMGLAKEIAKQLRTMKEDELKRKADEEDELKRKADEEDSLRALQRNLDDIVV